MCTAGRGCLAIAEARVRASVGLRSGGARWLLTRARSHTLTHTRSQTPGQPKLDPFHTDPYYCSHQPQTNLSAIMSRIKPQQNMAMASLLQTPGGSSAGAGPGGLAVAAAAGAGAGAGGAAPGAPLLPPMGGGYGQQQQQQQQQSGEQRLSDDGRGGGGGFRRGGSSEPADLPGRVRELRRGDW